MKKIKNKFIISVFMIIVVILAIGLIKPLLTNIEDKESFALLIQ
jgi:hypothetical protein